MWREIEPDETIRVDVGGHEVVAYSFGSGDDTLLLLNGGPGLPCEYLLAPHLQLVDRGWTVIAYDQLGCGRSDRPADPGLWTLERYVTEADGPGAAALRRPPEQDLFR